MFQHGVIGMGPHDRRKFKDSLFRTVKDIKGKRVGVDATLITSGRDPRIL